MSRCCLSYWFPKLAAAGLPVPRTEVVRLDGPGGRRRWFDLIDFADGGDPPDWMGDFLADLAGAAVRAGGGRWPVFLRTGQTSGKHDWGRTACLPGIDAIPRHVAALVEFSQMVDMLGLPCDVWALREMLPVEPVAVLPAYGGFPLVKEVRAFVAGGAVACVHPYWPPAAIADGFGMPRLSPGGGVRGPSPHADAGTLAHAIQGATPTAADERGWRPLAERVAEAFKGDGSWSVDLLATRGGWFVTDMAEAGRSFHWEGCRNEARDWEGAP